MSDEVKERDWVQVWALVLDSSPHPDDYMVRFESHNEHYNAYVRRDHVTKPGHAPEFVTRCTSMYEYIAERWIRCKFYDGHHGFHMDVEEKHEWSTQEQTGMIEDD